MCKGHQLTRLSLHNIKVEKFFIYLNRTILFHILRVLVFELADENLMRYLHVTYTFSVFQKQSKLISCEIEREGGGQGKRKPNYRTDMKTYFFCSHGFAKVICVLVIRYSDLCQCFWGPDVAEKQHKAEASTYYYRLWRVRWHERVLISTRWQICTNR